MKKIILLFASLAMILSMQAGTSREYVKQNIIEENECKTVAITESNGDAMIYGRNGWAADNCPSDLIETLHELNDMNEEIQDIHLTDDGRWLILYGNNGIHWNNLYYELKEKMSEYNNKGEKITNVAFNDYRDWIIITPKHISASSDELLEWLNEGCERHGQLWTACMTYDAVVAVYESGFKFYGNVPEDLKEALTTCSSDVYIVKMSGESWFFRCTDGFWRYNM